MEQIVKHGMKIDLHIHSCVSSAKDGKKVKNNTLANIPILISRMSAQGVNICAITDHDTFSYSMYKAIKVAETEDNSIQKVLPGVEFSVRFQNSNNESKVIHIITIFNDSDDSKIQRIETILNGSFSDIDGAYSEEKFLSLLRKIEIDTILIAHQKNTLSSDTVKKNDANSLGNDKFLEFVYSDYFEAFEFKNRRNEILNKNYLLANDLEEKVRFVTGTDCHDWLVYPKEDDLDNTVNFPYTFAKCLPSFRGLVMAMTDHFRLKRVDSFFNVDKTILSNIDLICDGNRMSIPLSCGINVIIGDNSIGKSMLLHALTGFEKDELDQRTKTGYKQYLKENKLQIPKQIKKSDLFYFDMQGEVRKKFEENSLDTSEFLQVNFPKDVDPAPYKAVILVEIDRLVDYLSKKFALDDCIKKLNTFRIAVSDGSPESITFQKNLRSCKEKTGDLEPIVSKLAELQILIAQLLKFGLDSEDKKYLIDHEAHISRMIEKYKKRIDVVNAENERIEIVAKAIDDISKRHSKSITDSQKKASAFSDNTVYLRETISKIFHCIQELPNYAYGSAEMKISENSNRIHDYNFVSKLKIKQINSEYFDECVKSIFKAQQKYEWSTMTEEKLKDLLLRYDSHIPVLQFFKSALLTKIEDDFQPEHSIVCQGMDKSVKLSDGFNSKIYFDLLSYETTRDGIYIIDQPEDNVSQPAIKSYLLDYFKNMGENRQVIMITHNPQFIVNLDVDNLIFMFKNSGKLQIQSGALEYECKDYRILDIVARNIDGGLDSIQKRWKRYEKTNSI